MSQKFIDEVRAIVLSNFSDEKFGVRELSSLLGLSSSQTLKKVKAETGKSVTQYIRELRLKKAAKLIKKTDHTIAEISYQVGFSSDSYFNKVFSKYYGIAPGEYKSKSNNLKVLAIKAIRKKHRETSLKMKIFYPVILILLLVIGYLIVNKTQSKNKTFENSIAVLPFKDFSPEDSQWFSDGISDNITHSLAQMKDISVISFTSSSTYRDTDKQIPEIAEELGVSYILEGSVTLVEDKIKIIAQLIDSNDEHIWSKEYDESFDNVITIQKNVAEEVMKQLEIILSPQEKVTLANYPTQNMEAYNLFLKGRLVDDSRKAEDLWKNIELNKQAIVLDSNFAEAYAEVAHSYLHLASYHGFDAIDAFEGIRLSHQYADQALNIDPKTFRAWVVKANLLEWIDWEKAEDYFKKAIEMKPNDGLAHLQYAVHYQLRPNPDIKKYLEHLTISQKLNPISQLQTKTYLRALSYNHKIKEAEDFFEKNKFQLGENQKINLESRIIAYKNKDRTTVIPFLKSKIEKDPNNTLLYRKLAAAYDEILNDDTNAIAYYKKAYEIDSTNSSNLIGYVGALSEGKMFKEAKRLMESENYKSVVSENGHIRSLWYYYYLQNNKSKTIELSKNNLLTNQYFVQVLTYAQIGDRKNVDSINKLYHWGTGNMLDWRAKRAITHAVLKDKDSMYHYLEEARYDGYISFANSRREMDPYRNEERYKAILRDNYIPIPGE